MNSDDFLDRKRTSTYRCKEFVREVWLATFGEDVADKFPVLFANGGVKANEMQELVKLSEPVDPCIVVMQRLRSVPHTGIWTGGKVLHLTAAGVRLDKLKDAARRFPKVSFYK